MSIFDPNAFLQQTTTDSFETRRTPVPEKDDYVGVVDDLRLRQAKDRIVLDVIWSLLDEELKTKMGLPKVTSRQSIFLDFDVNGKLAVGPNVNIGLGRLRDALGQNQKGVAWGMMMLKGAGPAKIKVGNRPDDRDASIIYDEVVSVTKLAA